MELSVEQTLPPASLLNSGKQSTGSKWSMTRTQWLSLILLGLGNFGLALCSGLQAPFFPQEAEKKGSTPAEYGLVFGLFYLTTFVFSPIFGKLMPFVGPDLLRDMGMFIVGVCFILFGFLDKSPPGTTFLVLAYLVRTVEGVGSAAYKTSNFAILGAFFPDNIASVMGVLETVFGIGLITGPTCGGLLYELGGYTLPFALSGSILVCISFLTICALPRTVVSQVHRGKNDMVRFMMDPLVLCYIGLLTVASMMIGFNMASLEPHLRQFHLTPVQLGLVFILCGGFYGLTSTIWGFLVDKKFNPTVMSAFSAFFMGIGFTFIGPAPMIPIDSELWLVGLSLVIMGCGYGATRVLPFVDCLRHGEERGFENNMGSYGMISGIFNGTFGIGFFLGPTVGGIAMETVGYNLTSFSLALMAYFFSLCFIVLYFCRIRKSRPAKNISEADPLLNGVGVSR